MGCIACAALVLDGAGVTLKRKESSSIPVEADSICPDRFVGCGPTEIAALPAFYGRRKVTLGDLFEIDGAGTDNMVVSGDLRAVKKIGHGMSMGRITVTGDVGPHLGAYMTGGEIAVEGGAGDWVGAHMSGGRIVVHGDAGHFVGARLLGRDPRRARRHHHRRAATPGGRWAARMRRGLIVVLGDAGEFAGAGMVAGSVFVGGRLGGRAGAGMKRGTIVAFGEAPELLPTFRYACRYRPVFLQLLSAEPARPRARREPGAPRREFPALRRRHEQRSGEGRSSSVISLNERAAAVVRQAERAAEPLRWRRPSWTTAPTVVDAGVDVDGSLEAGRLFAEVCMGGLGGRELRELELGELDAARRRGERPPAGARVHGRAVCGLGGQRPRDRQLQEVLRHGLGAGHGRCTAASRSSTTSTTPTPPPWPC